MINERLEKELAPLRNQLIHHPLYTSLTSINELQLFSETHVFAVWDFMSLVKKLQLELTCVTLPWQPPRDTSAARLINEIVWGEESDVDETGQPTSHFEMYMKAMEAMGAHTHTIQTFLKNLPTEGSVLSYIQKAALPPAVTSFLTFTFEVIENHSLHEIAAVFTFGREDLIPDMFVEMVQNLHDQGDGTLRAFRYYLERHIEVDGDQHGPMALEMIAQLCGNDSYKWNEVIAISKKALEKRIALWTAIQNQLKDALTPHTL
ncbi:MAG: DUF3050 domain-containing protein [Flavobacteriaceae bacterium]